MIHSPMYTQPYTHTCTPNHTLTHICTTIHTHVHKIITLTHVCTIITLTYVRTIIRSPMYTNTQTNQTDDNCKHATAANGWSVSVNWFLLQTTHSAHDGRKNKICTRQTGSSSHTHTLSMLLKMACSQKNTHINSCDKTSVTSYIFDDHVWAHNKSTAISFSESIRPPKHTHTHIHRAFIHVLPSPFLTCSPTQVSRLKNVSVRHFSQQTLCCYRKVMTMKFAMHWVGG